MLSFGTAGCNLACEFCQNWDISKSREIDTLADAASPDMLAEAAEALGCRGVAFTYNDPTIFLEYADAEIDAETGWIADHLGPDVPLHFTAFHPDYKMRDVPPTPPATLSRARRIALGNGLRFVYTGNVHDRAGGTTQCTGCGAPVVVRDWYVLRRYHLTDEGACRSPSLAPVDEDGHMAYTRDSVPDLNGRTAVITGANGGLGLQTTRVFASKGAWIVLAARDQTKAATAVADIRAETPDARLELVELDLASQTSVKKAAGQILAGHAEIDILVNNAGLMAMPERQTVDGYEMQLGVNHLGHWTLTASLMPALLAAPAARVVTVTSTAHHFGRALDPHNPRLSGNYHPWRAYGRSKLANYHFGLGLQQQFEQARVRAQSLIAHPGLSHTDLQIRAVAEGGGGWMGPFWAWMAKYTGMDVEHGAMPLIRAATDPRAKGGQFYGPRFGNFGPAVRLPVLRPGTGRAVRTLWQVSERETGIPLTVRAD